MERPLIIRKDTVEVCGYVVPALVTLRHSLSVFQPSYQCSGQTTQLRL